MIVGSNLKMNIGNSQISSACEFYVPPTINGATTTAIDLNGRDFQQGICYIDNAIKDAEATRNHLNQMRSYIGSINYFHIFQGAMEQQQK